MWKDNGQDDLKPIIIGAVCAAVALVGGLWYAAEKERKEWESLSDEEKEQKIKEQKERRRREQQQWEQQQRRDRESKQLVGKILRRARFRCEKCGQSSPLTVYYITNPYQGGECTYNNLQALCTSCCKSATAVSA